RVGVVREGEPGVLVECDGLAETGALLDALRRVEPSGRAGLSDALRRVRPRVPPRSRLFLASDLLSRAEPGLLRSFAGGRLCGALLRLRAPDGWSPPSAGHWEARDVETGERRTVRWTPARAAAVAKAASAHAERWALHAREAGLAYLPFAPTTPAEDVL